MKNVKIYSYGVLLGLIVAGLLGVFFIFNRMYTRDVNALEDFVAAYGKFDESVSAFSRPVFAARLDYQAVVEQLDELGPSDTSSSRKKLAGERAALTNEIISAGSGIIDRLKESDLLAERASSTQQALASFAMPLSHLSSLIKNDTKLGPQALEIASLSLRELDNVIAIRKVLLLKMEMTITTLRTAVFDNEEHQFAILLNQIKNQDPAGDLDKLVREVNELTDSRKIAFARFQNLGPGSEN